LSFRGPPPTSYTLSFFISKKSLKFDGGYCTLIEIAESFSSHDEEKITKGLAHCEERQATMIADNEKVYIFSNSVELAPLPHPSMT
jgi:hypothetical protein